MSTDAPQRAHTAAQRATHLDSLQDYSAFGSTTATRLAARCFGYIREGVPCGDLTINASMLTGRVFTILSDASIRIRDWHLGEQSSPRAAEMLSLFDAYLAAGYFDLHSVFTGEDGTFTPLEYAVQYGHYECAMALLIRGADPHAPTSTDMKLIELSQVASRCRLSGRERELHAVLLEADMKRSLATEQPASKPDSPVTPASRRSL